MALRSCVLAAALLLYTNAARAVQTLVVLHIKVTIDADGQPRPVPRHALLISDNPTSAAPRRIVTAADGTAEVRLSPGNYTVESDQPLIFGGRAYEWTQTLDVPAGGATLELTAANAMVGEPTAASPAVAAQSVPSQLLMQWQNSVVSIWSPTARGAGVVIDPRGLILTNARVIGAAKSVEVQLTPARKFEARVVAADKARDLAVLWIDAGAAASLKAARPGYSQDTDAVGEGQTLFTFEITDFDQKSVTSGKVMKVDAHVIGSDVRVETESAGAPLLTAAGDVVAITTPDDSDKGVWRAIRIDEAKTLLADAEKAMRAATGPSGALLPVEPEPLSLDALRAEVERRRGRQLPYQFSSADFDVNLITPIMLYGAHHLPERTTGAKKAGGAQNVEEVLNAQRMLDGFRNWSDYVREYPPVLMIRVTPKMVEGFWKSLGRVAAQTQGISLPAFKSVKTGFSSLRLYCGESEVTPIHPFKIEYRVDETHALYEGLYVFDAGMVGPKCANARLVLFSEKEPTKGDPHPIDAKILQQIADEFASLRPVPGKQQAR